MTFPVIVITGVPLWYNIVGNILGIVVLIATVIVCIFADDIDIDITSHTFVNIVTITGVGVIFAGIIAFAWGLIIVIALLCIPGLFIYGIRRFYWWFKHWRFYRKYDR